MGRARRQRQGTERKKREERESECGRITGRIKQGVESREREEKNDKQ